MKKLCFLLLPVLFVAIQSFARGHGHVGHGGGHSGGGHSSGGHSGSHGTVHSSGHASGHGGAASINKTSGRAGMHINTPQGTNRIRQAGPISARVVSSIRTSMRYNPRVTVRSVAGATQRREWYMSPYGYYYYMPYYGTPWFYDPFMSMWSLGYAVTYAPHYSYVDQPDNNDNIANNPSVESMDGFVVFENDTLPGYVSIHNNTVSLQTADSAGNYDYKFKVKREGLQYVTVYGSGKKQLNLVRLAPDRKHLWRIVHEGKLNLYDGRHGMIYKPGDIDIKTLQVEYDGARESLKSSSAAVAKEKLTGYVNKAYHLSLNPADFSWNELLIYIDKLD